MPDSKAVRIELLATHKGYGYWRVSTERASLDIYVTPTGLLRVQSEPDPHPPWNWDAPDPTSSFIMKPTREALDE